jgi:hypothetical protein
MRQHYDFSGAVRGKYAGRVDTTDIRRLDSAGPAQKNGATQQVQFSSESRVSKNQLFVERRADGDYAVRRPNSERASAVLPTQAEAIERARELNPGKAPLVERVRFTDRGSPDKWRKP